MRAAKYLYVVWFQFAHIKFQIEFFFWYVVYIRLSTQIAHCYVVESKWLGSL